MALLDSVLRSDRPARKEMAGFQISMVHYSKLIPSEKNDYSTENIAELANAILLAGGVKQNLLARKKAPDEYELIAGHRRRLAVKHLVEELGHEEFAMVPVHVERVDDELGEIQLILTNSSARERSDYEKMMEVDRLTELMKAMQTGTEDEKVKFRQIFGTEPGIGGRELRKLVAEKLGLSETKVANLQNISHNLVPELKDRFQEGSLGVSAANAAASLPEEKQMELVGKEEIRLADVKGYSVSESDTEEEALVENGKDKAVSESDTREAVLEEETREESVSESDTEPEGSREEETVRDYDRRILENVIRKERDMIKAMADYWISNQPWTYTEHRMKLDAFQRFLEFHDSDRNAETEPESCESPELPSFRNNDQRKTWLQDYKAWGLWYRDDNIDVNYYKYDFENGTRLIAAEYPKRPSWWKEGEKDEVYYHLVEKGKERYQNDGIYDEKFRQQTSSVTEIVEYLKKMQKREEREENTDEEQ